MNLEEKEVLDLLKQIKEELPNGEIAEIKREVSELKRGQQDVCNSVDKLREVIKDPEDGIIVKTNRNSQFISTVYKVLWIIVPIVLGLAAKSIFL